jgi:isoamylase
MKALTIGDSATIILGLQDEIRRTEESRVRGERPSRTARGGTVGAPETPEREAPSGNERRSSAKSGVVDPGTYDWEGDTQLKRPSSQTIVYEMHVRGFTRHPSSGIAENIRGTYRGLIEKISYLQQLGITAVELLPIFQFDAQDCQIGLVNYWGYAPVSFFAPHRAYSSRQDTLGPVDEFRDMVKALHRAGIEVILDVVVFNHTAEGDHSGPTLCFRGIDNHTYTSSNKIVRAMPTIAVLETHSILIIRSCAA